MIEPVSSRDVLLGKAASLTFVSLASPAGGFLLELVLTRRYGNTASMDAYRITGSILTIGTQLLLAQVLPMILVPLFTEVRQREGEWEAWRVALRCGMLLTIAATVLCTLALTAPELLARIFGPGLGAEGRSAAMAFLPAMSGALVMLAWSATIAAVLNCYGIFWTAPAATLLINVAIIACVFCWPSGLPVPSIRAGIVTGSVASAVVHTVYGWRITRRLTPSMNRYAPIETAAIWRRVRSFGTPLLAAAVFVHLFNVLIFRRLSLFTPGAAATYSFAFRLAGLIHLPAAALVTVAFPAVSDIACEGSSERLRHIIARTLRATLFVAVTCIAVLYVLRQPLVELLASHSAMSPSAVRQAGSVLGILLAGAPTGALIGMLQRVLASSGSTWGAALSSFAALGVAATGSYWTRDINHVAILWDVASWANVAILLRAVSLNDRRLSRLVSFSYVGKLCVAASIAGASTWIASAALIGMRCRLSAILAVSTVVGSTVALAASHCMQLAEASETLAYAAAWSRRIVAPLEFVRFR